MSVSMQVMDVPQDTLKLVVVLVASPCHYGVNDFIDLLLSD